MKTKNANANARYSVRESRKLLDLGICGKKTRVIPNSFRNLSDKDAEIKSASFCNGLLRPRLAMTHCVQRTFFSQLKIVRQKILNQKRPNPPGFLAPAFIQLTFCFAESGFFSASTESIYSQSQTASALSLPAISFV